MNKSSDNNNFFKLIIGLFFRKNKLNIFFVLFAVFIFIISYSLNNEQNNTSNKDYKLEESIKRVKLLDKPDFESFKDSSLKKKAFFSFLYPIVVNKNLEIKKIREYIKKSNGLDEKIISLCENYKVKKCLDSTYKKDLLKKINIIPPSIVLSQAAIESSWGTSRFAKEGNNFFGIWCFSKGCGLIPLNRDDSKNHEVKKFITVKDSVDYYFYNLNSHSSYKKFREIRLKTLKSQNLSAGLIMYSTKREKYIKLVNSVISHNNLIKIYDQEMFNYFNNISGGHGEI